MSPTHLYVGKEGGVGRRRRGRRRDKATYSDKLTSYD